MPRHLDRRPTALGLPLLSLLSLAVGACAGGSGDADPNAESLARHEGPEWHYEGPEGPQAWGHLDSAWRVCGAGKAQSPIDLSSRNAVPLPALRTAFGPAELRIVHHEHVADAINNGHTIQINYSDGDTLRVGDKGFLLRQYHFHAPSEHTLDGRHFPMEMHLVHQSEEGGLAVVGVFIAEGTHNAAFDPIWEHLPDHRGVERHHPSVRVDVNELLPASHRSYRYEGSLTTPPCSEGVHWIMLAEPIEMSAVQIGDFASLLGHNNRPIQPLAGRVVVADTVAEVNAG